MQYIDEFFLDFNHTRDCSFHDPGVPTSSPSTERMLMTFW
jgi:hypothetical protein